MYADALTMIASTAEIVPQRPRVGLPGIFLKWVVATPGSSGHKSRAAWKSFIGIPVDLHVLATVATVGQYLRSLVRTPQVNDSVHDNTSLMIR
eukprot:1341896-Pyramimonas_sp.AAC.2